jgi:hypothetical protein
MAVDVICHSLIVASREWPSPRGSSELLHEEPVRETIFSSPASLPVFFLGGVVCPVSMAKKAIRIPARKRFSRRLSLQLVPKT